MGIMLDIDTVKTAVSILHDIGSRLKKSNLTAQRKGLSTFSPVTGLDQSGVSHGKVSTISEPEASRALAAHILDTALQAEANLDSMVGADGAFSRLVGSIGLGGQLGGQASATDMNMKLAQLENPTTNPFLFGQPVAGFVPSLPILHSQFQATDPARAAAEAAAWQSTAASISQAVAELNGAISALSGSAETDWVREAIDRINRIQWAGGQYAAHATAMSAHTGNLSTVAGAEKLAAAAAYTTWLAAPPVAKPILEQSYMAAFTPRLNAGLVPTVPLFDQLLPPLDAMPGTAFQPDAIAVPATPSFERSPLPKVVQDALAANGFGELAYAETPTQMVERFGNATPQVMDAISAAATPTEAASVVAAPPAPGAAGAYVPVGGGGYAPGGNPAGAGAHAVPASLMPGGFGGGNGTGTGGGAAGAGRLAGMGVDPRSGVGARGVGIQGASGVNAGRTGGLGGANAAGALGGGAAGGKHQARSGSGAALGASAGAAAGGALGGIGRGSAAMPGAFGAGAPGSPAWAAGSGTPGAAGAPGGSSGQGGSKAVAMGGPMAGGAARGGGRGKNRKVRAVTSAVERQGNLRALLGEAPAVLPDVIGAQVRAPMGRR